MIELRLLGPPQVMRDGRVVALQPKRLGLLIYLVLEVPGRMEQRERLLGLFWRDHDPQGAKRALNNALSALRGALGDGAIVTRGDAEVGVDIEKVAVDALEFDAAIRDGQREKAVGLHGGPLLGAFCPRGCPEFEFWLDHQRDARAKKFAEALEQLAASESETGNHRAAAHWLERLAVTHPDSGRIAILLMTEWEAAGEIAEAIRAGERHAAYVRCEMEREPEPKVLEVLERLRRHPQEHRTPRLTPDSNPTPEMDPLARVRAALEPHYHVLHELGAGGWATVYLADDVKNGRRVAIKVLKPELAALLGPKRFLREIRVIANLEHRCIVPLFDSGEADGLLYYVMQYVEGGSLRARLQVEKQLSVDEALQITEDIAEALTYAHGRGVVHRDIKPANILLRDGHAVVSDFGLVRIVGDVGGDKLSDSGLPAGTVGYMSPEQASGEVNLSGRSDLYSLACVTYEMLAGEPPFTGPSVQAIQAKQIRLPPPHVRTVRDTVPLQVNDVIRRALSVVPADRFKTTAEFAVALRPSATAVPGHSDVASSRLGRRLSRVMLAVGVAAAAIVLLKVVLDGGSSGSIGGAGGDTTRYAILPFVHDDSLSAPLHELQRLHDAFSEWEGIAIVDPMQVQEQVAKWGSTSLDQTRAVHIARDVGAGRYVRGTVSRVGDSVRVWIGVYEVNGGGSLAFGDAVLIPRSAQNASRHFEKLTRRLLLRDMLLDDSSVLTGSRSLPSHQSFGKGVKQIQAWDLTAADSSFTKAVQFDPHFSEAHLWLALVRSWMGAETGRWRMAAERTALDRTRMSIRHQVMSDAVRAQARGNIASACSRWRDLTELEPRYYAAWYGSAHCLRFDSAVVRTPGSPSGWGFRTSYAQVLDHYQRAFELHPAILRSFRPDSYEPLRRLFMIGGSDRRQGRAATGVEFAADPSWLGDTLGFIPFPIDSLPPLTAEPAALQQAVSKLRGRFHEVAVTWVTVSPSDAHAMEALAIALGQLGRIEALDSLARARKLASAPDERLRIAANEVWMTLAFSLPVRSDAIEHTYVLVDSLLAAQPPDRVMDPLVMAGLAALTGRAHLATQYVTGPVAAEELGVPPPLRPQAAQLLLYSALGGPIDSLQRLERHVQTVIDEVLRPAERDRARMVWLGRPATLAFPLWGREIVLWLQGQGDHVVDLQAAWARGDSAALTRGFDLARADRQYLSPAYLTWDGLLPEAMLLAQGGDPIRAAAWLDPAFNALPQASLHVLASPVRAGALVRAMILRAQVADRLGDVDSARSWARAVTILWRNADPFLQPVVEELARLLT